MPAGQTKNQVVAVALVAGRSHNGYGPGEISNLLDPIAFVAGASNVTITSAGADLEPVENLRQRVLLAWFTLSKAGPGPAYEANARNVSQDIIDATAYGPEDRPGDERPGEVDLYLLTTAGPASPELIANVDQVLRDGQLRPTTDKVNIFSAEEVVYTVEVSLTLLNTAPQQITVEAAKAALERFASERQRGLGRDILRHSINAAVSVAGVYNVQVTSPAADLILERHQYANASSIAVMVAGVSNG